jgi:hypothetical protein
LTDDEVNEFVLRLAALGEPVPEKPIDEAAFGEWRAGTGIADDDFGRFLFRLYSLTAKG